MREAVEHVGARLHLALDEVRQDPPRRRVRTAARVAVVERRQAVGLGAGDGVDVQGHDEVGALVVGELRACVIVRHPAITLARPGQQHLRAEGGQTALHADGDGMADVRARHAARVDHDDLVGHSGLESDEGHVLTQAARTASRDGAHEAVEGAERVGPARAVGRDSHPGLELAERGVGLRPEHAVLPSRGEAQLNEPSLQLGDVVAGHEVPGDVRQHPVAQLPPGLLEAPEGLRPHDAVDGDATLLLERANGPVELVVEEGGIARADVAAQAQVGEP